MMKPLGENLNKANSLLDELNVCAVPAFVSTLGPIFNTKLTHSFIQAAAGKRPFADLAELQAAVTHEILVCDLQTILAILRDNDRLGAREVPEGSQTPRHQMAVDEHAGAGLQDLNSQEMQRFKNVNSAYEAKHGFCFVMAVAGFTKYEILAAMERRLQAPTEDEIAIARTQTVKLAKLRLTALFSDR